MDDESLSPLEETRAPSHEDLARLAAKLNERGAKYIVIDGFAVITAGFARSMVDIDLLIDCPPQITRGSRRMAGSLKSRVDERTISKNPPKWRAFRKMQQTLELG